MRFRNSVIRFRIVDLGFWNELNINVFRNPKSAFRNFFWVLSDKINICFFIIQIKNHNNIHFMNKYLLETQVFFNFCRPIP
jgi:hypothetical protein